MGGAKNIRDPRFVVDHAGDPEYSLVTRSSDGQMMFLANLVSKMKHNTPSGSRIAEVHNGSSLFTGDAGQGESNIRRWIIENDWVEAIVALPLKMFYNTGIATYVWVLSNRKEERRKGKVQLIDATEWFTPLRKNLGEKGVELSPGDIEKVIKAFHAFDDGDDPDHSKVFGNRDFGYSKIVVERPLRIIGVEGAGSTRPPRSRGSRRTATATSRRRRSSRSSSAMSASLIRSTDCSRPRSMARPASSNTSPTPTCATPNRSRSTSRLATTRRHRGVLPTRGAALCAGRLDRRDQDKDRLRDLVHPPLLQARTDAHPRRDPGRHPRAGSRD